MQLFKLLNRIETIVHKRTANGNYDIHSVRSECKRRLQHTFTYFSGFRFPLSMFGNFNVARVENGFRWISSSHSKWSRFITTDSVDHLHVFDSRQKMWIEDTSWKPICIWPNASHRLSSLTQNIQNGFQANNFIEQFSSEHLTNFKYEVKMSFNKYFHKFISTINWNSISKGNIK